MRDRDRVVWPAVAATMLLGGAASAEQITVTIENTQSSGGFSFTPFWLGFHDGTFDVFDPGTPASSLAGITEIAELGNTSVLSSRFGAEQTSGVQTTLVQPDAAPVFSPGEQAGMTFNLDPTANRYFNYAAMVVPSNDLFVGNPSAIELFDGGGQFNGMLTIEIFGVSVWDNGTEINDLLDGGAFVDGVDATRGTDQGGVITVFFDDAGAGGYLNSILGTMTADGGMVTRKFEPATLIGRITIVPTPGVALAFAMFGVAPRRRRARGIAQSA